MAETDTAETTGTEDPTYALVSVLYHALQGAETYEVYADDADEADEGDLAEFFRELVQEERRRAERAKRLLADKLQGESPANEG